MQKFAEWAKIAQGLAFFVEFFYEFEEILRLSGGMVQYTLRTLVDGKYKPHKFDPFLFQKQGSTLYHQFDAQKTNTVKLNCIIFLTACMCSFWIKKQGF